MVTRELVEPCLYNFLGYGNPNGATWFLGAEEGGAEIWRFGTLTLEKSLALRSRYQLAMDFRHVWEDLYEIPLESFRGPATWRYIAAFLLALRGIEPDTAAVQEFVFEDKRLGALDGDHFLCEFMPLPKPSQETISPYESVWRTVEQHGQEVGPKRLRLILDTLDGNPGTDWIISYDREVIARLLRAVRAERARDWTAAGRERHVLWRLEVSPGRRVHLLQTPFFGQGQISYGGIWEVAQRLREFRGRQGH